MWAKVSNEKQVGFDMKHASQTGLMGDFGRRMG
jgi:hypothetical protein